MTELFDSPIVTPAQTERALLAALAAGPAQIDEQIRCVLALSAAVTPGPAVDAVHHEPDPDTARLSALVNLADYLDQEQRLAVYKAIQALDDLEAQMIHEVRLALWLPPHHFQTIIRHAWTDVDRLETPEARARVLLGLTPLLTLAQDEPAVAPGLLEIVAFAQAIGQSEAQIRSLTALVPYLPHSMRIRVLYRILDEIDRLTSSAQRAAALTALANHLIPEIEARALRSAEAIADPAERARAFTALARYLPIALQTNLREDALTSISTITNMEERANALIAFAPHLEYVTNTDNFPRLLEHALAIAISIRRRHLRARVLVALAPHLTLDLQGEALAAVHSLSNERSRAMLLSQLAPALPSDMLIASLAVANSMNEQDARVHALTTLAHYVPESARGRTIQDALDTALSLTSRFERVSALVNLADELPPALKDHALTSALNAAHMIENENAAARALSMLAPVLPMRMLPRALEMAQSLQNAEQRLTAVNSLAQVMDESERHALADDLFSALRELPYEYKRARAMAEISPLLPDEAIADALNLAQSLEDPVDRATALIALIPRLDLDQRRRIMGRCWQLITEVENGYDAASALVLLSPYLPLTAAPDLSRMASMIIGSIMDEYDQASAIAILAPLLAAAPDDSLLSPLPDRHAALQKAILNLLDIRSTPERLSLLAEAAALWVDTSEADESYALWQHLIQHLHRLPLADTMPALSLLSPVIRQLAGEEGVETLAQVLSGFSVQSVAQSG